MESLSPTTNKEKEKKMNSDFEISEAYKLSWNNLVNHFKDKDINENDIDYEKDITEKIQPILIELLKKIDEFSNNKIRIKSSIIQINSLITRKRLLIPVVCKKEKDNYVYDNKKASKITTFIIVCTLGIQIVVFSLMNNWMTLTRGPLGIPGIPGISLFGVAIESKWAFLSLTLVFAGLVFFFLQKLTGSAFGRSLRALSEDEIFTQSLGKNVYLSKVIAFTVGAMIAAIPGALYAHYISYIDPTSFTIDESIFILSIVIIGGMRNLWGSVIAAAFLVFLPEFLRFVGMPNAIAANMRQIIYGGILILMMFQYSKGFEVQRTKAVK